MPCQESIADAKEAFMIAVSRGVEQLMNECGYSRDRATSALMRELNRDGSTAIARPSNDEIFSTMKRHHLGIEESTRVLLVSKALRRAMVAASPSKAIQQLTNKISMRNLIYDSADEQDRNSSAEEIGIRPEHRIQPNLPPQPSSLDRSIANRKSKASPRTSKTKSTHRQRTQKSSSHTSIKSNGGRKRSIEEIAGVSTSGGADKMTTRARADSVTREVDAKLAQQQQPLQEEPNPANDSPISRPVTSVARNKRTLRSEDEESTSMTSSTTSTNHKRLRSSGEQR